MLAVAPMLDRTDRHFRYFMRLISHHVLLYTEMVSSCAILHGDPEKNLGFDSKEKPLVLQLGGGDPDQLGRCVRYAEEFGYDGVNLNVGCPSDRVHRGGFGACLMKEPGKVADCVSEMSARTRLPVTVKCRIGVDEYEGYDYLVDFVTRVAEAGCGTFILHARKAWLKGLSPKENRSVPPLRYDYVYQLKKDFPSLTIVLNGGIVSLDQADHQLSYVDGVMMGRAVYENPYLLAQADRRFYDDDHPVPTREEVLQSYLSYVSCWLKEGVRLNSLTRHILGLYHGQPGARRWRRHLSRRAFIPGADSDTGVLQSWLRSI